MLIKFLSYQLICSWQKRWYILRWAICVRKKSIQIHAFNFVSQFCSVLILRMASTVINVITNYSHHDSHWSVWTKIAKHKETMKIHENGRLSKRKKNGNEEEIRYQLKIDVRKKNMNRRLIVNNACSCWRQSFFYRLCSHLCYKPCLLWNWISLCLPMGKYTQCIKILYIVYVRRYRSN